MAVLNKRAIVTAIEMYGVTAIRLGRTLNPALDVLIKALFTSGEQGFAYDPNDLTTLYQDAAGAIPVTAAGQPVGLMLDKSKGLVLGAELAEAGGFDNATKWTKETGWSVSGGNGIATNANGSIFQDVPSTAGRTYLISGTILSRSTGSVRLLADGADVPIVTTSIPRVFSYIVRASLATIKIGFRSIDGFTGTVDNVSVRELAGNHAYQTTSAARPILQQTPILGDELITNGDFSNGTIGWGGVYGGVLSTQNGNLVITSDGTSEFSSVFQQCGFVSGKRYKISFKVVDATQSAGAYGFVSANNTGSVNRILTSSKISSNGFYESEFTASSDTKYITIGAGAGGMIAGEAIYFDDVSVREVTGYRTDQNYLAFDGVDDFLQTNSIDFTATDKVSLFAGVRKLSDATAQMIVELSTSNVNIGMFSLLKGAGSLEYIQSYLRGSGLGSYVSTNNAAYAAPSSLVVAAKLDINGATKNLLRVNAAQALVSSVSVGTGNYGNYPLYIGRRGGTSIPFNGNLYGLIGISRLTTDTETLALEKAIAKATGVTLNV